MSVALISHSQNENNEEQDNFSITEYDNYCPTMGGDSIKIINGMPAQGFVKEMYDSINIKHKGYYQDGKIFTGYTNYYPNGQVERVFKPKSEVSGVLEVYYPDGTLLSRVEWVHGTSRKWQDYHPDGTLEFEEEFNKKLEYYEYMHFYFPGGKPFVKLDLIDKKSRTYSYTEYWENGNIKETGSKIHNRNSDDYPQDGKWLIYDENGKLILEETYVRGQLVEDKSYQ